MRRLSRFEWCLYLGLLAVVTVMAVDAEGWPWANNRHWCSLEATPSTIALGEAVKLYPTGSDGGTATLSDGVGEPVAVELNGDPIEVSPKVDTTYTLILQGSGQRWRDRWARTATATVKVTKDPEPEPSPTPDPNPIPKPVPTPPNPPTPTALWFVVIEETGQRTPAQAAVLLSPKTAALFGGKLRIIDAWTADGKRKTLSENVVPYVDKADALSSKSAAFIVSPTGVLYYSGKVPATVAELQLLVAKIRGESQ